MTPPPDWPLSRPIATKSSQLGGGVIEVEIEGAGIAGQVLHRELYRRGIPSRLTDRTSFPREKVCGGVLQWDSWQYLTSAFRIPEPVKQIHTISHFFRRKLLSLNELKKPMVYVSRWELDEKLYSQQRGVAADGGSVLRVNAKGVSSAAAGEWIGFQGVCEPVEELQMHYGRGICAGVSPTLGPKAHLAFIVKRGLFRDIEGLKKYLWRELGLTFEGSLKGTGRIHYGYSPESLAVGDAKMATFPFRGLGMKHAILSAQLLAEKIAAGDAHAYATAHRRHFRRWHFFSAMGGILYDSPFQGLLKPLLRNRGVFFRLYNWLHAPEF